MPIFEYNCTSCGNKFEELVRIDDNSNIHCNQCGSSSVERLLSAFGFISTGSMDSSISATNSSSSCSSCSSHNCANCR